MIDTDWNCKIASRSYSFRVGNYVITLNTREVHGTATCPSVKDWRSIVLTAGNMNRDYFDDHSPMMHLQQMHHRLVEKSPQLH